MNEADNLEVVPDPFDCDGDDDRDHDYNPDLEAEFDGSKKKGQCLITFMYEIPKK